MSVSLRSNGGDGYQDPSLGRQTSWHMVVESEEASLADQADPSLVNVPAPSVSAYSGKFKPDESEEFIEIDPSKVSMAHHDFDSASQARAPSVHHHHRQSRDYSQHNNGHKSSNPMSRLYRADDVRMTWASKTQQEKCKYLGLLLSSLCCLLLIIVVIVLLVVLLSGYTSYDFEWLPPMTLTRLGQPDELVTVNAQFDRGSERVATRTTTTRSNGWPFGNVIQVMDFEQRQAISIDDRFPRTCFVFPIDDKNVDFDKLYAAADQTPVPKDNRNAQWDACERIFGTMQTRAADHSWKGDTYWVVDVVADKNRHLYTQEDESWDEDEFDTSKCGWGTVLKFSRANTAAIPCQDANCQEVCLPEFGISSCAQMAIVHRNCFWLYEPKIDERQLEEDLTNRPRFDAEGKPINSYDERLKMERRMMSAFYAGRAQQQKQQVSQLNNMWVNANGPGR